MHTLKRLLVVILYYTIVYVIAVAFAAIAACYRLYYMVRFGAVKWPKRRELPPSCLDDPTYGRHCYVQIKNIKLHYVENGDKEKPLMLFIHGFPDFWYSWRYQIKHFSEHYWTVAVDMRGFGDSEKPVGVNQYQIKYLVNDIKNVITALGKEKCILVAHDWGAIVGWYFLFKYPDMVEKYIMINMYPIFKISFKWVQFFKSWYTFVFQLPFIPEFALSFNDYDIFDVLFKGFSADDIEAYKFTFGKPGGFTYGINYYRANLMNMLLSRGPKLGDNKLPDGLLIYTDNDRFLDVSNFEETKTVVDNLQTSYVKSATHFLHQRKHEDTNKIISRFLNVVQQDEPTGKEKSVLGDDASS